MNEETLTALKDSIRRWRDCVEARTFISNCALCHRFTGRDDEEDCEGCPVMKRTGKPVCQGTPFYEALDAHLHDDRKLFVFFAEKELAFLESLLPEGEQA